MGHHKSTVKRKERRRNRSKKTSFAHPSRNRLVIHRSLKHFEAQVIDDFKGHTIFSASSKCKDLKPALKNIKSKTELSQKVGEAYSIQPGHDGWVVGDKPAVVYEFHGMWGE